MDAGAQSTLLLLVVGAVAGIASGLFGIGGGLIIIPMFTMLLKMDAKHATATSLAVVVLPVALPAVLRFHRAGHIDWRVVLWVAIGFAVANPFGARLNLGFSEQRLRQAFALLLIVTAVRMALQPATAANADPAPPAPSAQQ